MYASYTDHYSERGVLNKDYLINIIDFTIINKCSRFVQGVINSRGSDEEAVLDGFKAITELKRNKKTINYSKNLRIEQYIDNMN